MKLPIGWFRERNALQLQSKAKPTTKNVIKWSLLCSNLPKLTNFSFFLNFFVPSLKRFVFIFLLIFSEFSSPNVTFYLRKQKQDLENINFVHLSRKLVILSSNSVKSCLFHSIISCRYHFLPLRMSLLMMLKVENKLQRYSWRI